MKMKMDNVHLSLRLPLAQKRGVGGWISCIRKFILYFYYPQNTKKGQNLFTLFLQQAV